MSHTRVKLCLASTVVGLALAVPAYAQDQGTESSFGVRAGLTADPKQGFIGAQIESPGLAPHLNLTFRPNVEIGFGSGATQLVGSLDFAYWVRFPGSTWSGYIVAGPEAVWAHEGGITVCADPVNNTGCTTSASNNFLTGGFGAGVGFQHDSGIFIELKRANSPSLRLTVGFVLKKH
jgi:hypothetical protein